LTSRRGLQLAIEGGAIGARKELEEIAESLGAPIVKPVLGTACVPMEWWTSRSPSRRRMSGSSSHDRVNARISGFASDAKRSLRTPADQKIRCSSRQSLPTASP